jgi:AraC family transcriptional regulator
LPLKTQLRGQSLVEIVDRSTAEGLRHHIHGKLLTASSCSAWRDIQVQLLSHQHMEQNLIVPAVAEPLLVWILSGSARIEERELKGDWAANDINVGDFFLTNSATPYEMHWQAKGSDPFEVMHLYLGLSVFEEAAQEIFSVAGRRLKVKDISGQNDRLLSLILQQVRMELTATHSQSAMYVEGLAKTLAVHIVRNYTEPAEGKIERKSALPAMKLRRVVDLMEAHLDEEFSLSRLAEEAAMSEYHFTRLFKQATSLSPSQYFIRLKMAKARSLLRETDLSIIQIGMDVGYSSPSHFSQVFRRVVGVSPRDYRD